MTALPEKLKQDSIIEALFEIRFEHTTIGEMVVGGLAGAKAWAGYTPQRLPLAELPAMMREADVTTRYSPTVQLSRPDGNEIVRIGPNVASLHVLLPYPGWTAFRPRLEAMLSSVYEICAAPNIQRLGLRYVNALTPAHQIKELWDLQFQFSVPSAQPVEELTAQYQLSPDEDLRAKVTLASPGYVLGNMPADAKAVVDVDIFTLLPPGTLEIGQVIDWLDRAHEAEKQAFFSLWPEDALQALRES